MTPESLRALVDTIVVVMMENRSFDHVLGFLSHEAFGQRTDVDGLHLRGPNFDWDNPDAAGNAYPPTATPDSYLPGDLPHGRPEIATALDSGAMDGFIKAYFASQSIDQSPSPMRFCRPQDIPVTAALAQGYTVCDRWFASLPVDTQPNRLMAVSGYTLIDSTAGIKPPFHLLPDQRTVFDWLKSSGTDFEIYVDAAHIDNLGVPSNMLLMKSQWELLITNSAPLSELQARWSSAEAAPGVIYCEPFYNDFATALGMHGNCNHPPLPMAYGEDFLKRVYETLTSNPAKWARTVLIICSDEHGGFFDHVAPPPMNYAPPPGNQWTNPASFTTLGIRIPGLVISPLVDAASAYHGLLDHTSILQLLVDRFGSPGVLDGFGDAASRKAKGVQSIADVLTRPAPRADVPGVPAAPTPSGNPITPPVSDLGRMFQGVYADQPAKRPQ